jgi:capsular polysaccharide transport system permease protein
MTARQAMATFRAESRIVDPEADISGEMAVLTDLQRKLSDELMTLELLRNDAAGRRTARNAEVAEARITQSERRIAAIRDRLAAEREKFGGVAERDYTELLTRFETLSVELEFAQQTYVAALGALDMARVEARRQSRYLAIYEAPRVPDAATGPRRATILAAVAASLLLLWSVVVLTAYGLRDRM